MIKDMFEGIGYGLIVINIDANSPIKCQVSLNQNNVKNEGFTIINKFSKNIYDNLITSNQK